VLVHNAGAMPATRTESTQGHELTMSLHVLGPTLLTDLLAPVLTDNARVLFVTSGGMYSQVLRADDPEYLKGDYARARRTHAASVRRWSCCRCSNNGGRPPASTRPTPAGPTPPG